VVQGPARPGLGHHGRRLRRRHRALHPLHLVDAGVERATAPRSWPPACCRGWSS
jgi:hypothetical protein